MAGKRYTEIDIAKGIGIISVVLLHALKQTGEQTAALSVIITVIFCYVMPLFFLLSGFTASKVLRIGGKAELADFAKKRARRLLIPYATMSVLYMPLKYLMNSYALKPYDFGRAWVVLFGESPNTLMWFVYVLFLCSVIGAVLLNEKNLKTMTIIFMAVSAAMYSMEIDIRTFKYMFFFTAGILIRCNYDTIKEKAIRRKALITVAGLGMFAAGAYMVIRYGFEIFYIVTGLSATAVIYVVSLVYQEHCGDRGLLRLCGEYSMDIYILSEPIMIAIRLLVWNMLGMSTAATITACLIGPIVVAIPLSMYIIRKVKPFRLMFLGMD